MKGLIAAAGTSTRLQDLADRHNKVLLDLGGATVLGTILDHFEQCGVAETTVVVGFDAPAVRTACGTRARCVLNPFFEHYGILGSLWVARPHFEGEPFVFTVGDHYFSPGRLRAFLDDQPGADVLADVELKTCDDEDMKVFVNRTGQLRTITKTFLDGPVLGEFTGAVRFSAEGSAQLFTTLEKYAWQHGLQGYVADVLCALHRRWGVAFHLSPDHDRVEIDFPCDLTRARELFAQEHQARRTG
jgi:choline kinase